MFIGGTLAYAVYVVIDLFIGGPFGLVDTAPELAGASILVICCAPVSGIVSVIGVAIQAAITQFFSRLMGGMGTYSQLLYGFAAYYVPISIISVFVSAFASVSPFVVICLSLPLSLYTLVLFIIAINAVNQFGWGKSVASGILVPLVIFGLVACGIVVVLSLLGPQIGDVFSEIIRTLEAPTATGA